VKIMVLLLVLMLYLIFLTSLIVRDPRRDKDHSVLLRIITNYFSELLMIKDLNLQWPVNISNFFSKITVLTSSSSALIKINCFFQNYDDMSMSTYVIGMVFFAVAPVVFAVLSYFPFLMLKSCNRAKYQETYFRNYLALNFTFIFLVYPTITNYTFGMFTCTEVEDISYLSVDFNIECWSQEHTTLLLNSTLPIMIIWVFGFPLLMFRLLYQNRMNLDNREVIAKYGLYYIGFTDKSFYWQVVIINLRRVLYIGIAVAVQGGNKNIFVFLIFLIMYIYMSGTRWIRPYQKHYMNDVDAYSSLTTSITLLSSVFFIYNGDDISDEVLTAIFIILIIMNSAYLLYWLVKLIPTGVRLCLNVSHYCCP